ncbi:MAG: class I SAM-dependent methyltransferase [Candidatus Brocadiaceae bacterium]|nr:class I SAM-dependent methyltransferase [Candidatus Brocadiaceae bacterium]
MTETTKQVLTGHNVYNKLTLSVYDLWVLGITNSFIWRCPSHNLLELYNQHVSENHLDIGVGTGFFLDRCKLPTGDPRVALMDINSDSLAVASKRIRRYDPEIYLRNIFESIRFDNRKFDSIGMNYLLHCLPGTMQTKEIVFQNIKPLLNTGGVIFGSTVLGKGVERNIIARCLMTVYNKRGIFTNNHDSLTNLKEILNCNFSESSVTVIGCVALFWGQK